MITKGVIDTISLAHEPDAWIKVRALSGTLIREAKAAKAAQLVKDFGALSDLLGAMDSLGVERPGVTPPTESVPDPTAEYDGPTLLRVAIVEWSYDEPVTPENIAELDPETERVVLEHICGKLGSDPKNGSSLSTTGSKGKA